MPEEFEATITFRAPQSLRVLILAAAAFDDRTPSNWMRRVLQKAAAEAIEELGPEGALDRVKDVAKRAESEDDVSAIIDALVDPD